MDVAQDGRGAVLRELAAVQSARLVAGLLYGRRVRHRFAVVIGALAVWLGAGFAVAAVAPAAPGRVPPLPVSVATYFVGALLAAWGLGAGDRRRIARWLPTLLVASVVLLLLAAGLSAVPHSDVGESRGPTGRSRRRTSRSRRRVADLPPVGAPLLLPATAAVAAILGGPPADVGYDLSPARAVLAAEWRASAERRIRAVVRDQAKGAALIRAGGVPAHGRQRQELVGIGDRAFVEIRAGGDTPVAASAMAAVGTWAVMVRIWGADLPEGGETVLTESLRSMVEALSAALAHLPSPPRW